MNKRTTARKRRQKMSPLFIIVMGISLMLAGSWSYQLFLLDQSMESAKAELLKEKQALIAVNEQLRQEIEKLNTPSYIEQLAREKLGLVRKGEIVIAPKQSTPPE
ncbi:MAG: FtsB family cell division protein [Desulfitobacteriia bacterium]|jgi:cell division protein DivIC